MTVYFCTGTDKEKLDWFRVINIAGERLLDQELRNAVYVVPFVTDARRYFSKNGCAAYKVGGDYMTGKLDEQAYLETILKWAARHDEGSYKFYCTTTVLRSHNTCCASA